MEVFSLLCREGLVRFSKVYKPNCFSYLSICWYCYYSFLPTLFPFTLFFPSLFTDLFFVDDVFSFTLFSIKKRNRKNHEKWNEKKRFLSYFVRKTNISKMCFFLSLFFDLVLVLVFFPLEKRPRPKTQTQPQTQEEHFENLYHICQKSRMREDSNPRSSKEDAGFQDRDLKPLRHSSYLFFYSFLQPFVCFSSLTFLVDHAAVSVGISVFIVGLFSFVFFFPKEKRPRPTIKTNTL